MSKHVVLLGDSIFDNGAYTGGQPAVIDHLRSQLPQGRTASLLAVDGARTADLPLQLARVPASATHLVVSIGGNDALANLDLLATPVSSTAAALSLFDQRASQFESGYRQAIAHALELRKPVTLCTIYNGNLPPPEARIARVALMLFNDTILRVAFERGLDLIDLRLVCTQDSDYANNIEPSGSGGRKIARAVGAATGILHLPRSVSRVFIG